MAYSTLTMYKEQRSSLTAAFGGKWQKKMMHHLSSGLCSFNNASEMLLRLNVDIVSRRSPVFKEIRCEIESMKQEMEDSVQIAQRALQMLNEDTVCLTAEQSNLSRQKRKAEMEFTDLQTRLQSHHQNLDICKNNLQICKNNLSSAEDTLDDMRRKRREAEDLRDAGVILMIIPVFGWITGGIMAGIGQSDMNTASEAAETARKEVNECKDEVTLYSDKVSKYKSLARKAQRDVDETDTKIREAKANLKRMSVMREVVADFQETMRKVASHLGLLSEVGNGAEVHTRRLILMKTMMKVMKEMMSALAQITGEDLLNKRGLRSIMQDMKRNRRIMLEKVKNTDDSESDNYESDESEADSENEGSEDEEDS